jgi:hypothetical protein
MILWEAMPTIGEGCEAFGAVFQERLSLGWGQCETGKCAPGGDKVLQLLKAK